MRKLAILVVTLFTTSPVWADPNALGAGEVKAHVKAVDPQIGECYLGAIGDRAGAGRLDIKLTIHRKGIVDHIDVIAPGVPAATAKKIDACVRAALDGISFPTRRVGTTAVVPYFWQKTAAPDSGPQYSCWNPKGCKTTGESSSTSTASQPKKKPAPVTQARRAKPSTRS